MTQASHRVRLGIIYTLMGGSLWGLNGTLAQYLMHTYAIDPLWLVCIRLMTCCWLFLAAAAFVNRSQLVELATSPSALLHTFWVSMFAILSTQIAYLQAIHHTNSATATVLQTLCVVLVLLVACVRQRRAARRREVLGIITALAGTFLLTTGGNPAAIQLPPAGLFWGLACAVANALLALLPGSLMERFGNFSFNGIAFLMAGVPLMVLYQPWLHMPDLDVVGWMLIGLACLLGTFGAYALYLQGVAYAGSVRASLLGTVEPVVSTLSTVVALGTVLAPLDIVGMTLIIIMVFLTTVPAKTVPATVETVVEHDVIGERQVLDEPLVHILDDGMSVSSSSMKQE